MRLAIKEYVSHVSKCLTLQRLGKNVSELVLGWAVPDLDLSGFNSVFDEEVSDVDVSGFFGR